MLKNIQFILLFKRLKKMKQVYNSSKKILS